MKKTIIITLTGMILLAFTQCASLRVSKEYKDVTKLLKECEESVKKASNCEELDSARFGLAIGIMAMDEYSEKDKMTDKEEKKLMKYTDKVQLLYDLKAKTLDCEEDEE